MAFQMHLGNPASDLPLVAEQVVVTNWVTLDCFITKRRFSLTRSAFINAGGLLQEVRIRWRKNNHFVRTIGIHDRPSWNRNARFNVFRPFVKFFAELGDVNVTLRNTNYILASTYVEILNTFRRFFFLTCPNIGPKGGPALAIPAGISLLNIPCSIFSTVFFKPGAILILPITSSFWNQCDDRSLVVVEVTRSVLLRTVFQ